MPGVCRARGRSLYSRMRSSPSRTIQVIATDDPAITELAFVERLDAISAGADQVLAGMQHNYDALVALTRGPALPACR